MQHFIPQGIPAPQQLLKAFVGSLGLWGLKDSALQPLGNGSPSCPSPPDLSCQTQFQNQDTCCFNYPGGHLLQTQFWDFDPASGPDDSWTIHGLW
jgi:ribonuclease T2